MSSYHKQNAQVKSDNYIYNKQRWKVQHSRKEIIPKIMDRIFDQLSAALSWYSKVFVVRFELMIYEQPNDNKLVSKFFDNLKKRLHKHYGGKLGLIWAREQSATAVHPHYHCAVYLNGHKAHKAWGVGRHVEHVCGSLAELTSWDPKNAGYMVHRGDTRSIQEAIYRVSYLAKRETKDLTPKNVCTYQASRLKHNPDIKRPLNTLQ